MSEDKIDVPVQPRHMIEGKHFNHYLFRKGEKIGKRYKEGDLLDFGNNRVYRMRKDGALINVSKKRSKR